MAKLTLRHFRRIDIDDDGRVQTDVPCAKCDHSLFTLSENGRCPECGFPVAESIFIAMNPRHPDDPRRWHPGWTVAVVVLVVLTLIGFFMFNWLFG